MQEAHFSEQIQQETLPEGAIVYHPESMTVLKVEEACMVLDIGKPGLYKKVRKGDLPAYIWGPQHKYLLPREPANYKASSQERTEPMVFVLADIENYLTSHPNIADEAHQLDEGNLARLREYIQDFLNDDKTVSYKRVLRHATRRMKKHYTVLIPAILKIVDQEHWTLEEQEDIDHIVEKGRELLAQHGYVQRTALFEHMLDVHKKGTRFYPEVAYVARRERWPLESPTQEKTQRMRIERQTSRHRPSGFNPRIFWRESKQASS